MTKYDGLREDIIKLCEKYDIVYEDSGGDHLIYEFMVRRYNKSEYLDEIENRIKGHIQFKALMKPVTDFMDTEKIKYHFPASIYIKGLTVELIEQTEYMVTFSDDICYNSTYRNTFKTFYIESDIFIDYLIDSIRNKKMLAEAENMYNEWDRNNQIDDIQISLDIKLKKVLWKE